jgi:hypothetical protein
MQRPGSNPEQMEPADFVCDFCGACWGEDRPMVEGHRGSLICGRCLSRACEQVLVGNAGVVVPEHVACAMCLLNKSGDYWQSPLRVEATESPAEPAGQDMGNSMGHILGHIMGHIKGEIAIHPEPGSCICRWCIERSAAMLEKDAESGWTRPR